jgi:hypothetical protein
MQVPKDEGSARLDGVAAVDVEVPAKGCEARTPPRLRRRSERTGCELVRAERARVEGVEVVELPACQPGGWKKAVLRAVEGGLEVQGAGGLGSDTRTDPGPARIVPHRTSRAEIRPVLERH